MATPCTLLQNVKHDGVDYAVGATADAGAFGLALEGLVVAGVIRIDPPPRVAPTPPPTPTPTPPHPTTPSAHAGSGRGRP